MKISNKIRSDSYRIWIICFFTVMTNSVAYTQTRSQTDFDNNWKFKLDSVSNYSAINVKTIIGVHSICRTIGVLKVLSVKIMLLHREVVHYPAE